MIILPRTYATVPIFFAKIVCLQYIDIQLSGIYSNRIFDMKKAHRYRIDMPSENMTTKRNN